MWYLTVQKTTDQRPVLHGQFDSQDAADAYKAAVMVAFPDAEMSAVFEEDGNYPNVFPHVMGLVTNSDGSVDFLWSDGVRTSMPV